MILRSMAAYLFLLILIASCELNFKRGNGKIEISEYDIDTFHKVYVGGNYDVTLIPSKKNQVVIETDENLFRYINVENQEEALNINNVHKLKSSEGIFIEIYYKSIDHIYSTGMSKIGHEGILESDELIINLSGAGSVKLDIYTHSLEIVMSGAGVIELSGNADIQQTYISGAGGLMAENLKSKECDVNLSGIGGANVYVSEKLGASITGIGGITYSGNPKLIEKQVSGLGKIIRKENFIEEEFEEEKMNY